MDEQFPAAALTHGATYKVGPHDLDDYDREKLPPFDWLVYHYSVDGYEGGGIAVWKHLNKDAFGWTNLGHCSCFGPTENANATEMSLSDVLADIESKPGDFDFEVAKAVVEQVKRLTSVNKAA